MSRGFALDSTSSSRPIVGFLAIYSALFVAYLAVTAIVCHGDEQPRADRSSVDKPSGKLSGSTTAIWIYGLLFRVIFVPSIPILEIDIYRYLWDGGACRVGVDPYRYSPAVVRAAEERDDMPSDLRRLVQLRESTDAYGEILGHIHYEEYTTIYPPASQLVFALSSATTPAQADAQQHLFVMKLWLTLFDLGTFALVIGLLRELGKPLTWAVGYGWCPLVIKEIAGSGHLDSIAVFWTTLAIFALVRFAGCANRERHSPSIRTQIWLAITVAAFATAVAAKLYPLVLAPVFLGVVVRVMGWPKGLAAAAIALGLSAVLLWPMLKHSIRSPDQRDATSNAHQVIAGNSAQDTRGDDGFSEATPELIEPGPAELANESGLQAFISTWEMNDLLFMLIVENLRPNPEGEQAAKPWFVIVPNSMRANLYDDSIRNDGLAIHRISFRYTRLVTLALVAAFGVVVLCRQLRLDDPGQIVLHAFLLLAVFWVTSPTQNPWYWIWCLPFLFAARNPGWWIVSGAVGMYYIRFLLSDTYPETVQLVGAYSPSLFFHFVIVPFEHAVWLAVWGTYFAIRIRRSRAGSAAAE